jgi:hypothetical protein
MRSVGTALGMDPTGYPAFQGTNRHRMGRLIPVCSRYGPPSPVAGSKQRGWVGRPPLLVPAHTGRAAANYGASGTAMTSSKRSKHLAWMVHSDQNRNQYLIEIGGCIRCKEQRGSAGRVMDPRLGPRLLRTAMKVMEQNGSDPGADTTAS